MLDQSLLTPNAKADDYYLRIYSDVPEHCKNGFVGYIGSFSNPEIEIKIEIDDKYMFEGRMLSCCFCLFPDDYPKSLIVMTSKYFEEFRSNPTLEFVIWHEIGHFHTMHYFDTKRDEQGSTQKARTEYFNRREIMPEEKAADLFAVYYTSQEDAIQFFNYSIKRRRENLYEDRDINDKAVAELARRKRFIREIDCCDENIRTLLCELCGQSSFEQL